MAARETFLAQRRRALFEEHRPRLRGIAYRILGSVTAADDVLEETRGRWAADAGARTAYPAATLTAMATRLAVDRLAAERAQRRDGTGTWLPEPLPGGPDRTLSFDLLIALERLSALERAAYVLRVALDLPYPQVAAALARSGPATRQLVHRARRHLPDGWSPSVGEPDHHDRVVQRLRSACRTLGLAPLLGVLAGDAVLVGDAGRSAAARLVGRDPVGRFLLSVLRRLPRGAEPGVESVNGAAAVVIRACGEPVCVLAVRVEHDRVSTVHVVTAVRRLEALRASVAPTAIR